MNDSAMERATSIAVFVTLAASISAEIVFRECKDVSSSDKSCIITQVTNSQCEINTCILNKGDNFNFTINFTPNLSASDVEVSVNVTENGIEKPDFAECDCTVDTIVYGIPNTLSCECVMTDQIPEGTYEYRAILSSRQSKLKCCAEATLKHSSS